MFSMLCTHWPHLYEHWRTPHAVNSTAACSRISTQIKNSLDSAFLEIVVVCIITGKYASCSRVCVDWKLCIVPWSAATIRQNSYPIPYVWGMHVRLGYWRYKKLTDWLYLSIISRLTVLLLIYMLSRSGEEGFWCCTNDSRSSWVQACSSETTHLKHYVITS